MKMYGWRILAEWYNEYRQLCCEEFCVLGADEGTAHVTVLQSLDGKIRDGFSVILCERINGEILFSEASKEHLTALAKAW